ncbi:galactose-1-epimerase [Eggerthia catenaformis]|nr:galactose-1-epimerase [Eggerthia catenaformis]
MAAEVKRINNVLDEIILKNEYLEVHTLNLGCTITKILVKDKHHNLQDVVLGYDDYSDYLKYDGYLGALVGRVANRIGKGQFTLNNRQYHLAINNGPNTLHGGIHGFSYRLFNYEIEDDSVIFTYLSPDGEENFPGNLLMRTTYRLNKETLEISYQASGDQDTLINITNHSYFNLDGIPDKIDNHYLKIKSSVMAESDTNGLVTGTLTAVDGTPFDFRHETKIKDMIYQTNKQLEIGHGYDHPFIFDDSKDQVTLYSEKTGIELTVNTTYPLAQIYSANYLDGRIGKNNKPLNAGSALCIETQYMPDSIHLEEHSKTILKKGQLYDEKTSYTFKIR